MIEFDIEKLTEVSQPMLWKRDNEFMVCQMYSQQTAKTEEENYALFEYNVGGDTWVNLKVHNPVFKKTLIRALNCDYDVPETLDVKENQERDIIVEISVINADKSGKVEDVP